MGDESRNISVTYDNDGSEGDIENDAAYAKGANDGVGVLETDKGKEVQDF